MKLSIIIPVFNEERTIGIVLGRLKDVEIPGVEKEIIVVDDGSTDATEVKIRNSKFEIRNLKVLRHAKNLGKGAAVRTGIAHATGEYVIIQDADLEYDPNDIRKLLKPIEANSTQVVYGSRLNRLPNLKRDEKKILFLLHYLGNRFLSFLTSILYGQWLTDMETCYKLFPRKAVEGMSLNSRRFDFEPEITAKLMKKGYRIYEIPISTKPRGYEEGKKLNTVKDGLIALWSLLKYRLIN